MDPQPDVIRQQIDETRSSLTEKLETLEAEVKGTVQTARETVESAKESVQETISNVKETVASATETVKRTFDLEYQVDRHPFAMLGLSLVSGVCLGAFLGGRVTPGRRLARRMSEASVEPPQRPESAPASAGSRLTHDRAEGPGFVDKLSGQLGTELDKVKDLAIGALVGVIGDVARKSVPVLAHSVEDLLTRTASQFGLPPQQYGGDHPQRGPEPRDTAGDTTYRTPPAY